MEVPTIYKAYFLGLCMGIYPQKYGHTYGTNVPPFSDPGSFPLTSGNLWLWFQEKSTWMTSPRIVGQSHPNKLVRYLSTIEPSHWLNIS